MKPISPPHPVLTMMEGRVVAETGQTLLSLPLLRLSAPRGKREPVMVLPGFMTDDRSTYLLRNYLRQIGYTVYPWGLGTNRRPLVQYLPAMLQQLQAISDEHEMPVRLVGWSRGGIISREVAREAPRLVDRVITMGSPVKGGVGATSIGRWVQREVGISPEQMMRMLQERNVTPIRVPVRALYSKSDGVVSWEACLDDDTENFEAIEINCSHTGMGSSTEVFRLVPRLLKEELSS